MSVICHIVGMNDEMRDGFINSFKNYNNLVVYDIDELSNKIINDNFMNMLFNRYDKYMEQSKMDKSNKNLVVKYKSIEKKMNIYWKSKLEHNIDKFIKNNLDRKIILIGLITHYKNNKLRITIETSSKFFVEVNNDDYVKKNIENNLDKYRQEIINGEFPIEYLSKDFLIRRRETVQTIYIKMGYLLKPIDKIKEFVHINLENSNKFDELQKIYIGLSTKLNDIIYPFYKNQVIGWDNELEAILYTIDKSKIEFNDNSIKKLENGILNGKCYIYIVGKDSFVYKGDKYITTKPVKIIDRIYINNIGKRLKELKVKIIK